MLLDLCDLCALHILLLLHRGKLLRDWTSHRILSFWFPLRRTRRPKDETQKQPQPQPRSKTRILRHTQLFYCGSIINCNTISKIAFVSFHENLKSTDAQKGKKQAHTSHKKSAHHEAAKRPLYSNTSQFARKLLCNPSPLILSSLSHNQLFRRSLSIPNTHNPLDPSSSSVTTTAGHTL